MLKFLAVVCLLLNFGSGTALAQSSAAGVLHIGVQHNYPPFVYQDNGRQTGVCTELAEAVFRRLGQAVSYRQYPFARMLKLGELGEVDAVMLVFRTPERERYLEYPAEPLCYEENSLFVRVDSDIKAYSGDLSDLKGSLFGVVLGFSYGKAFDEAGYLRKESNRDELQIVSRLVAGRLDIGVGNREVVSFYAKQIGAEDKIRFLEPNLFVRNPLYLAFSRRGEGGGEMAAQFSRALSEVKRSDEYSRILLRYGLNPLVPYIKR